MYLTWGITYIFAPVIIDEDIKYREGGNKMAKLSRGGRMTAAKRRAAKSAGGNGMVKNRPAGRKIMST